MECLFQPVPKPLVDSIAEAAEWQHQREIPIWLFQTFVVIMISSGQLFSVGCSTSNIGLLTIFYGCSKPLQSIQYWWILPLYLPSSPPRAIVSGFQGVGGNLFEAPNFRTLPGVELGLNRVPFAQKLLIRKALCCRIILWMWDEQTNWQIDKHANTHTLWGNSE